MQNKEWQKAIQKMIKMKVRAEQQAFAAHGLNYVHEVYLPETPGWHEVVDAFGKKILRPDGTVDRKKLGQVVFNRSEALARLNAIVHPRILQVVQRRVKEWNRQRIAVVIIEAALLIEAGWSTSVDEVWVTIAFEETVVRRLVEGHGVAEDDVRTRIQAQLSNQERRQHADVLIRNDGNWEDLRDRVGQVWFELCRRRGIALAGFGHEAHG